MASSPKQPRAQDETALIESIDKIQQEINELNEKASEEILKVEQKYNKKRQPLFKRRSDLCEKVPNFWASVLLGHPQISEILSEHDEKILHYLTRLDVIEHDDIKSGYKINFTFDEKNPYFTNKVLTKEVEMSEMGADSKGTKIDWKEGMEPARRADNAQTTGTKRPRLDLPSFFSFFVPKQDEDDGTDHDQIICDLDDVADFIRDEIWPNPLQFYLSGEMDDDDDEADDDEADDDEVDEDVADSEGDLADEDDGQEGDDDGDDDGDEGDDGADDEEPEDVELEES